MANGIVRRRPLEEDIPDGMYYKTHLDNWTSPKDGKSWYRPNDPKNYRK